MVNLFKIRLIRPQLLVQIKLLVSGSLPVALLIVVIQRIEKKIHTKNHSTKHNNQQKCNTL